jgi:hypothetical protein
VCSIQGQKQEDTLNSKRNKDDSDGNSGKKLTARTASTILLKKYDQKRHSHVECLPDRSCVSLMAKRKRADLPCPSQAGKRITKE